MLSKIAFRNVTRNSRRSTVAVSTITLGVFGLMFLEGFFGGLLEMHKENAVRSRYGHGQVMSLGYWEKTHANPVDHWIDQVERVTAQLESSPQVQETYKRVQFFAMLSNGAASVAGRGTGIEGAKEQEFFDRLNFIEGGAIGERVDGITLGVGLARSLNAKVGDRVTVLGQTSLGTVDAIDTYVTGIFHIGMKEADDMMFQVQLKEAQRLLDTSKVESVSVRLVDESQWDSVQEFVAEKMPGLEALSVYELDRAWAFNGKNFLTALMNIFKLTFLGMILLAIYNSTSNAIVERRGDFAMLRANGDSLTFLKSTVLMESVFLAVAGFLVAVTLYGLAMVLAQNGIPMPPTPGTTRVLPVPLKLSLLEALWSMGLGGGAVLVATMISFNQISKIPIIGALRGQ